MLQFIDNNAEYYNLLIIMQGITKNNDRGLVEHSLLAASPEDGYPPGLSLAEVPGLLGPMVPRVQTIVVSAQNIHKTFLTMSRNLSCKSRN